MAESPTPARPDRRPRSRRPGAGASALLLLACALLGAAPAGAAGPQVVVSLPPLHSLVAQVLGERGQAELLLRGGVSPHRYALRPSDARALDRADLVVWVGPEVENFLAASLRQRLPEIGVLSLGEVPGMVRWPARQGGLWLTHQHQAEEQADAEHGEHESGDQGHDHVAHAIDPHYWLDPRNGRLWLAAIGERLARLDPPGAAGYRRNAASAMAELERLEQVLSQHLAPVRERPYLVFHDAYQYFERRFGLHPAGSISVTSGHAPGLRRVLEIRRRLTESGADCLFSEPQFEPRLAARLVEGTRVRLGQLDPIGADTPTGAGHYAELLGGLATALLDCLGPP